MKTFLRLLVALTLFCCTALHAQWANIYGDQVRNASGGLLASGQFCVQPVDSNNRPIIANIGSIQAVAAPWSSGATTITIIGSMAGIRTGQSIDSQVLTVGTTVTGVSGSVVTLSLPTPSATSGNSNLSFGGGAVVTGSACTAITNGVFGSPFQFQTNAFAVPDTSLSNPLHLCLRVTVIDSNQNGKVVYSAPCVQPSSSASWCATDLAGNVYCNYDLYSPLLPAQALVQQVGVMGPTGATGAPATVTVGSTTTGAAGTSASVNNAGSSSAVVLNFTIPQGATGPQGASAITGMSGDGSGNATLTGKFNAAAVAASNMIPDGTPVIDVRAYGAALNGTSDDTAALQSAVTDCFARSGSLYIPSVSGKLHLAGAINSACDALICAPSVPVSSPSQQCEIYGNIENEWVGTGGFNSSGVIQTAVSTGTDVNSAIIGVPSVSGNFGNFDNIILKVHGLSFLTYPNPAIGGINCASAGECDIDHITYGIGEPYAAGHTQPTNSRTGVILPLLNNWNKARLHDSTITGVYTGYKISEHADVENVNVQDTMQGVQTTQGYHSAHLKNVSFAEVVTPIVATGGILPLQIDGLDLELDPLHTWCSWCYSTTDISDPNSYLRGDISFTSVTAQTGAYNTLNLSGGYNLVVHDQNARNVAALTPLTWNGPNWQIGNIGLLSNQGYAAIGFGVMYNGSSWMPTQTGTQGGYVQVSPTGGFQFYATPSGTVGTPVTPTLLGAPMLSAPTGSQSITEPTNSQFSINGNAASFSIPYFLSNTTQAGSGFISGPAETASAMTAGGVYLHSFGVQLGTNYNSCSYGFKFTSLGSTSNGGTLSCYGINDIVTWNAAGNVTLAPTGTVTVAGGGNTLYRCTTAGTLPVGALTTVTANCGASTDTGLRTK